MKEMRFRAWDNSIKKMIDPIQIQQFEFRGDTTKGMRIHYTSEEAYTVFTDDFELMQYTGLKDKNGRRIYEGDVVKFVVAYTDKTISENIIEITFWEGGFWHHGFRPEQCEVIGNIYKNPDLIRVSHIKRK